MAAYLITGATGFVGSHVADVCRARGIAVRTVARPSSDTTYLDTVGATVVRGELTDPHALAKALDGVEAVVHCAAKVGDWGDVEEYRAVNVEGLRRLLDACIDRPLKRFVHVSSLGVYAARHHYQTDETEQPPARHVDGYTQSKVEAEHLALDYQRLHGVPVAVLRPGFIYGPRDRTVLPQLAQRLRDRGVVYFSGGGQAVNTTYVGNLVDAIFLALESPKAVGEVFNVTDGEHVSKKRFFETVADGLKLPRPTRNLPLWLGRLAAWALERRYRRKKSPVAPRLTQAKLKFVGLNLDFSIAKARKELGYEPKVSFDRGMAEALAWYREHVKG